MVFSTDIIKNMNPDSIKREKIEAINYEENTLFETALEMILSESIEFNNMISSIDYINEMIVGEAKESIDTKAEVINLQDFFCKIFDWFIESITKLSNHFNGFLLNFTSGNKELEDYKKKLSNYNKSIKFTHPYYQYKNLFIESSYTSFENEINKEYDSLISDLEKLKNIKSNMQIVDYVDEMYNRRQNENDEIDSLRGRILGANKMITKELYPDSLFLYFRTTSTPINSELENNNIISSDRIKEAYDSFYKSSSQKMQIRRDYMKMKTSASKINEKYKDIKSKDFLPTLSENNGSVIRIYNNIISYRCKRMKAICEIYTTFFAAKLDAIKEYNFTNKKILLETCTQIVKDGE